MNNSKAYAYMLRRLYSANRQKAALKGIELFIQQSTEFDKKAMDLTLSMSLANRYLCVPKQCYWNCISIAKREKDLTYYEGYATSFVPMSHGWLVTKDGEVIEPTLVTLGSNKSRAVDYFGMAVPIEIAEKANREFCPSWLDYFYAEKGGEFIGEEKKEKAKK